MICKHFCNISKHKIVDYEKKLYSLQHYSLLVLPHRHRKLPMFLTQTTLF